MKQWHGTRNGYQHHRCRCEECREAQKTYCASRKAYRATYYKANQKKEQEQKARYATTHRKQKAAYQKMYRNTHRQQRQADFARWCKENPDKVRDYHSNRRTRKRNAFIENIDRQIVLERDNGICGICKNLVDTTNYHIDHIIPLAKGGKHHYNNVQIAHPTWNWQKYTKLQD